MSMTTLAARTEQLRREVLSSLDPDVQAQLGQFFTPSGAASLIATMSRLPDTNSVSILDPGAGVGSLTIAAVERLIAAKPGISISVTAVELDESVLPALRRTMEAAQLDAAAEGATLSYEVVEGSYLEVAESLGTFDLVVMNPPYGKLDAKGPQRALMDAVVPVPNIYAAFMALGVTNLAPEGQLVAIVPRSFMNGTYFTPFRAWLLHRVGIDRIHVFESRSTVFADTGVLQENVIVAMTAGAVASKVALSVSTGHLDHVECRLVPIDEVVHPQDPNSFIRIPSQERATDVVARAAALPASLADLGVKVSTGRVVDFRSRLNLHQESSDSRFPMVYPAHISRGVVSHPRGAGKPEWYEPLEDRERKNLVPEGTYVLIKRFSAKEERRRIVAGTWNPARNGSGPVAFDNKTNFLHISGGGLDSALASGISLWLNSTFTDEFFRTFSGHTQVNAGDLRSMRFPDAGRLRELGGHFTGELPDQAELDQVVEQVVFAATEARSA